eukprot:gene41127-50896_t
MQNLPSESSPCNTIAPSEGLAEHSRFFQRLHRRYEQDLPLLPPGAPTRALMEQTLAALRARGTDMASALRMVRQLVMDHQNVVVRDAKTGEDLTRSILLQIILEEEAGGAPMSTEAVLANIIRFYGHAMQ